MMCKYCKYQSNLKTESVEWVVRTKEIYGEVQIVVDPPEICLKPIWIVRRGNEHDFLVVLEPKKAFLQKRWKRRTIPVHVHCRVKEVAVNSRITSCWSVNFRQKICSPANGWHWHWIIPYLLWMPTNMTSLVDWIWSKNLALARLRAFWAASMMLSWNWNCLRSSGKFSL